MKNQNTKSWYIHLIKGIIMVILSIVVFIYPQDTLKTGVEILGILVFIPGIVLIIRGISLKKDDNNWNLTMVEGLAYLILGFLLAVAPLLMAALVPYMIGILAAFYGIIVIIEAFRETGDRTFRIIAGIFILLLASVLIFKPLLFGLTVVVWLGIVLLGAGSYNICLSILRRKKTDLIQPS